MCMSLPFSPRLCFLGSGVQELSALLHRVSLINGSNELGHFIKPDLCSQAALAPGKCQSQQKGNMGTASAGQTSGLTALGKQSLI